MNPMPETDFIDYLKTVDSPTVSNAIELLKVRAPREGFVPLAIHSLFPEFGRMVAYAVTAQVETVTQCYPASIDLFVDLYRLVGESPKPAVIAFQEIGGYPDYAAHCGEVMATMLEAPGRDRPGFRLRRPRYSGGPRPGIPIFRARGRGEPRKLPHCARGSAHSNLRDDDCDRGHSSWG